MKNHRSSLFLIELILVLFFFLLTAAACVRVLAKAHTTSRSALELSHGQNLAASAAEVLLANDGKLDSLLTFFPEGELRDTVFQAFLDGDFSFSDEESALYTLSVTPDAEPDTVQITFSGRETEIFSLPLACHTPERRS